MSAEKLYIKLEAMSLPLGGTTRDIECPWCPEGDKEPGSLAVTRLEDGLAYICYRAKCKHSGFIFSQPSSEARSGTLCKPVREFHRPLKVLPNRLRRALEAKYQLSWDTQREQEWKYDYTCNRLYMPVFNYAGYQMGAVSKRLSKSTEGPKTVLYGENGQYHRLHYPRLPEKAPMRVDSTARSASVVIVEDILSSAKVAQLLPSIALLGTHMSQEQACEIAGKYSRLIIALDPDAYDKALLMADKFGILFQSVSVLDLDQDPKDTPWAELEQALANNVNG